MSLGLVATWALGLAVALLLPAAFVAPTAKNPPPGDVVLAFGCTLVGSIIMIGVATAFWRRTRDSSVMVLGLVPAFSCIAGGVILAGAKLGAL